MSLHYPSASVDIPTPMDPLGCVQQLSVGIMYDYVLFFSNR